MFWIKWIKFKPSENVQIVYQILILSVKLFASMLICLMHMSNNVCLACLMKIWIRTLCLINKFYNGFTVIFVKQDFSRRLDTMEDSTVNDTSQYVKNQNCGQLWPIWLIFGLIIWAVVWWKLKVWPAKLWIKFDRLQGTLEKRFYE